MIGNGVLKKKMPTNAAAASARITLFFSDRLPIRKTASSTIARTAALSPKNTAAIAGTWINNGQQRGGIEQHVCKCGNIEKVILLSPIHSQAQARKYRSSY